MRKYFVQCICMIMIFLVMGSTYAFKYNVLVPPNQGEQDYQGPTQGQSRVSGQESDFYIIVDYVSEHLIFFIAIIAFFAVLYTGYQFISGGAEKAKESGLNLVKGIGLAVFVALFSYAFVRIVTNLI